MFRALYSIDHLKDISTHLVSRLEIINQQMRLRTGLGSEFLGWIDLPSRMQLDSLFWQQLEHVKIRFQNLGVAHVVVIGIGGSYLGTRAIYEILRTSYSVDNFPKLHFVGHHLSGLYLENFVKWLEDKNFALVVISKSGTTLEPALALRILRQLLIKRYGTNEANERIVAITDQKKGILRQIANTYGWSSFIIEDSIGGRYSVLSPVGIVPLYLVGIDCKSLLNGATYLENLCFNNTDIESNPSIKYALYRNILYNSGYRIEIMSTFQPESYYLVEWWKQLFGESEGKDKKGLFPAGAIFSTDLHSLGQFIQDGTSVFFETFLIVKNKHGQIVIPFEDDDFDKMNYLAGRSMSWIETMAEKGTILAHHQGGVPVQMIFTETLNEYELGRLIYFFEYACAVSSYLFSVNPFDQPGVEAYKKNMFSLLGKQGNEFERNEIDQLLKELDLSY